MTTSSFHDILLIFSSRTNEVLESSCSRVVGDQDTQYIWSRYKLRGKVKVVCVCTVFVVFQNVCVLCNETS